MDPKISGELSVGADEESEMSTNATTTTQVDKVKEEDNTIKEEKAPSACASNLNSGSSLIQGDETVSKREDSVVNPSSRKAGKGRKSSPRVKDSSGKRKVKVDWTPELHRQFVEAVEHLGVDKAVPSKILELMGIDCLTRHNVASHLQKYRSHKKHLLAREAEAATWAQRRQIYGTTGKRVINSLVAPPTTGFPPPQFRPLHVWGHPSVDQSLVSTWHSHPPPPRAWAPPLPGDPSSFWYCHHQDVPAPGMPCYPPSFLPTTFTTPPPPSIYRVAPTIGVPVNPTLAKPPLDSHPSKENIDAVIGDVLTKPWLPLPLGLKPPSIDSVVVELQRQGISNIPPSCA